MAMNEGRREQGESDPSANDARLERAARQMTAMSRFLKAGTSLLWRVGVLAGIVVVIVAGVMMLSRFGRKLGATDEQVRYSQAPRVVAAPEPIPWDRVDAAVAEAAQRARECAVQQADGQLDAWVNQLMARIDADFLPWYFSYWHQQGVGLAATWQGVKYNLAGYITGDSTLSPAEQMAADIQQEFRVRVLRPASAQLFLEQLTRQTIEVYLGDLQEKLAGIQVQYRIPQADWDRYLHDIAVGTQQVEAGRQVPLSLKALAGTSVGAGAALVGGLAKIGAKLETRLAAKAGEKAISRLAAKTGTKMAAKAGGRFLGPAVAVGIIVWDIYDHRKTVAENQPILRESLGEYLGLLKESLLNDSEGGVAAAMHQVEAGIVQSLGEKQPVAVAK